MSDCKKFGPKEGSLSPEDRLAEVEKKFTSIIERIQSYDQVLDQFKTITQKLIKIDHDNEGLNEANKRSKEECKASSMQISVRLDAFLRSFQDYQRQIENVFELLKNSDQDSTTKNEILKGSQAKLDEKVSKLSEITVAKGQFDSYKSYNDSLSDSLHSEIRECCASITRVSQSIAELSAHQKISNAGLENIRGQFRSFSTDIDSRQRNVEASIERISASLLNFASKADVESSYKTLKADLSGTPTALDSIKSEIIKKFEIASLDASNSVLKANNCAKQIELMERKIENLALIVKKHELSK